MSSSAIQLLIATAPSAPPSTGAANAAASGEEDASSGQQFAQLLSDSGAQTEGDAPQFANGGGVLKTASVGSVVAQEVSDDVTHGLDNLFEKKDELLTPEKAELLLARVEQLLRGKADNAQQAVLGSIKEQLQGITRGEAPKTLGAIVQAAIATHIAKDSKLSITALFAMLSTKKSVGSTKTEEAPTSLAANMQAIPAAIFRTTDGEAEAAAATTLEKTKKEQLTGDSITVITPLAATNIIASQTHANVGNDSANQTIQDLDAVIAPLKLQGTAALPAIELPKLMGEGQAQTLSTQALTPSLLASSGALSKESAASNEAGVVISDKSLSSFSNLLNPSHSNGFSPTQTANAAQPVQAVPTHGFLNHAPVAEQVKIAVHQAAKDGLEHITIQLDPVGLGRVEVNMKTNHDGLTQISFIVDKPDTFDGLSRDARFLERSLQESGIKSDTGRMQFNLRQQPQPQLHSDLGGNRSQQGQPEDSDDNAVNVAITPVMNFTKNYILNIREGVDISA